MWDLSSLTRDGTLPTAVEAWNLNYCTAGEVPQDLFSKKTVLAGMSKKANGS